MPEPNPKSQIPPPHSSTLDALEEWIGEKLGRGSIANMACVCALAAIRAGVCPPQQIELLVKQSLFQGLITPPAFFYAALLDLCERVAGPLKLQGQLKVHHLTLEPVCLPPPAAAIEPDEDRRLSAWLHQRLAPSRN